MGNSCDVGLKTRETIKNYSCSWYKEKPQVAESEQGDIKVGNMCGTCITTTCGVSPDVKKGIKSCFWYKEQQQETGTTETATHYQGTTMQPIELMQEYLTPEQFIGFLRGNVLKYQLRLGRKGDTVKDALKCWQYADWLVKALKGEKIVPGGKTK